MKITSNWTGNRKPVRPKSVRQKPKIRWQSLGLTDPREACPPPSMEEIRRQAVTLSGRGLSQGARSRTAARDGQSADKTRQPGSNHPRRRGATE